MTLQKNWRCKEAPIGIFDSGVGGLTVAREIARSLPNEHLVYFGDTARVPYGNKSKDNIIHYSRQIIRFLQTKNVKAIVIACNTASALALDVVCKEIDVPIIGVIVPGAKVAVETTKKKKIGVIGTQATIQSGIYTKLMQQLEAKVEVVDKACPLFVPLVEEGFAKHNVTKEIIDYYLNSIKESGIDTMILGCTHYPLLRSRIKEYLGENITLVNPAYETTLHLQELLEKQNLLNETTKEGNASYEFYVSDAAEKFKEFANSIFPYDASMTKEVKIEEY